MDLLAMMQKVSRMEWEAAAHRANSNPTTNGESCGRNSGTNNDERSMAPQEVHCDIPLSTPDGLAPSGDGRTP